MSADLEIDLLLFRTLVQNLSPSRSNALHWQAPRRLYLHNAMAEL
jgi:hypothetical protein